MELKVLIITVRYSDADANINEIKNIDVNRKCLMLLFKKYNPTSINNPKFDEFGDKLVSFLKEEITNDDTLLVYYAGHGLKDQDNREVYLETNNSKRICIAKTSYPIKTFVEDIKGSIAKRKIIIIDSCYSGAAHPYDNVMGFDNVDNDDFLKEHFEKMKYEGVYILTSTKKNEQARYPNDKPTEPTYFTGELLDIFNNGLKDDTKENINFHALFNELKERLKNKRLPEPCQSNYGNLLDLPFWPNKSYKTNTTEQTNDKTDKLYSRKDEITDTFHPNSDTDKLSRKIDSTKNIKKTFVGKLSLLLIGIVAIVLSLWHFKDNIKELFGIGYYPPHYSGTTLDNVSTLEKGDNGVFYVKEGTTEIGIKAFYNCKKIKKIILPKSLKEIASEAFAECTKLESIELPDDLTFIGMNSFLNCKKLSKINIPLSVSSIFNNPFVGCNLKIDIPQNHSVFFEVDGFFIERHSKTVVSYTGNQEYIVIPKDIRIIGESAFATNNNIIAIDMSETKINEIRSFGFAYCSNIQLLTFSDSLKFIGKNNPFIGIHFKNTERVEINSNYVNDNGYLIDRRNNTLITYLGNDVKIKFYRIENNIDSIGAFSFAGCNFILAFDKKHRPKCDPNAFYNCNKVIINQFNNIKK